MEISLWSGKPVWGLEKQYGARGSSMRRGKQKLADWGCSLRSRALDWGGVGG